MSISRKCDSAIWRKTCNDNGYGLVDDIDDFIVLDVGFHTGAFAAACLARGASYVLGYEPDPKLCEIATENLSPAAANQWDVKNAAIWHPEFSGLPLGSKLTLQRHDANNSGTGSLVYQGDPDAPEIEVAENIDLERAIGQLGDAFGRIDLLKLDCEGAEYPLLYNCDILGKDVPNIVCEFHESDKSLREDFKLEYEMNGEALAEFLHDKGYVVVAQRMEDTGVMWASVDPDNSPFEKVREEYSNEAKTNSNDPIKVNLVAGSGTASNGWIFSHMTQELVDRIDSDISLTVTAEPDTKSPYDIVHYMHSTLAVKHRHALHRAVVTVHALNNVTNFHQTFQSKEDTLQQAPVISSVSRFVINDLVDGGIDANKITYTPQGVLLDVFTPPRDGCDDYHEIIEKFYETIDEPPEEDLTIRLGLVGRCYDDGRKGEGFLFDIMHRLCQIDSDIQYELTLVGPWWQERCQEMASQLMDEHENIRVLFPGHIEHKKLPAIYRALDATLVTSKAECGPMCTMESLACGTPVISTPGGNANEFLTRFNRDDHMWLLGTIVGYGDVPGFAKAIRERTPFVNMGAKRTISLSMRESEDVTWLKHINQDDDPYAPYTWQNWADRFADIYRSLSANIGDGMLLDDVFGKEERDEFRQHYRKGATKHLSDMYVRNFMQVMPYAKTGIGISKFVDVAKKVPTVIVGVGPSLDDNMDLLRKYQDNLMIVTCDAGTKKLIREGVTPDVVFAADPTDRQIENFSDIPGEDFITMMPTVIHPMTFHESRKSDCKVAWYNIADENHEICRHIPRVIGGKGAIIPAVLTTGMAFIASLYMGSWPITFIGSDLCWYDLTKGYADGMSDQKTMWQQQNKMIGSSVMLFPDTQGQLVVTEPCFVSFWQWMNDYLTDQGLYVHNSSGQGILHGERITQTPFRQWVQGVDLTKANGIKDKLMKTYDTARQSIDVMLCHQFSDEEMKEIRNNEGFLSP